MQRRRQRDDIHGNGNPFRAVNTSFRRFFLSIRLAADALQWGMPDERML